MTKQEFLLFLREAAKNVDQRVVEPSAEDYAIVEKVYTWHPAIADVGGKWQIAEIYAHGGMLVIRDMLPRAEKAEEYDGRIRAIRKDIAGMEQKVRDLMAEILA